MGNVSSIVDNRSSSNSQSFGYDHCDRLLSWTLGGATESYAWEEVVGGAIKTAYEFDEKLVAVRDSSAGVSYLHGDHLDNVALSVSGTRATTSAQEFDPWDQVRSGGISQTSLNDTGQRLDGSGLLYYHARMDDPALARFVSADSIVPGVGALTLWSSDETAEAVWKQGGKHKTANQMRPRTRRSSIVIVMSITPWYGRSWSQGSGTHQGR